MNKQTYNNGLKIKYYPFLSELFLIGFLCGQWVYNSDGEKEISINLRNEILNELKGGLK